MKMITPDSEDFLYWDPEDICNYPVKQGPEDHWIAESIHEQLQSNLLRKNLLKKKETENEQ